MLLTCPQCGFSRDVNDSKLAGRSVIITCPKCACRFRHSQAGFTEILPSIANSAQDEQSRPEEEEDIRQIASRAYRQEANRFKPDAEEQMEDNPWQAAPGEKGWFWAFSQTVLRVMFSAPVFFKNLSPTAALGRPLCFYLILCIGQALVEMLWGQLFHALLSPVAMGDPQMEKVLAMLEQEPNLIFSLLMKTMVMAAQLYIFSFLMALAYRLVAPQNATFPLVFQIMAYSSAPAVLCVIPVLGSITGLIWGLGCLAVGCKYALNINWGKVLVGFLPLLLIWLLLFRASFKTILG